MRKGRLTSIIVAFGLLLQALTPAALAAPEVAQAFGSDTIAGYSSLLRSSLITPGEAVIFLVTKPDSAVVRVPAEANLEGLAKADFYGHQTKKAGEYRVSLLRSGGMVSGETPFRVYPDQLSATQSVLSSTRQMLPADSAEETFLEVLLYDAYQNPIQNHQVQLISSRKEDSIAPLKQGVTDAEGRAHFKVSSKHPGVSVFTAMDVALSQILSDREEIVFSQPAPASSPKISIGGNFLSSNLLGAQLLDAAPAANSPLPGPLAYFDIEDLSPNVTVGTDLTVTVVARDANGNPAKNYTGTVLFSTPDDENAVLPNNGQYSFKESDQGRFTFNLALRFSKTGQQAFQVFDQGNWKLAGEKSVSVSPKGGAPVSSGSVSGLSIKSPVDGSAFGSSTVVLTGQGDPNINLKFFDNDAKIGDGETDGDGFFTFQAKGLSSGTHSFYVMSEAGKVSPSVSVSIDTTPPVLYQLSVNPQGIVAPGQALQVVALSEPELDSVKIRFQGMETSMAPGTDAGSYTATLAAPALAGAYAMDVLLTDALSNRSELLAKASVQVQDSQPVYPPQVQGFQGMAGDASVSLSWQPVLGHAYPIQGYRIHYGLRFDQLDKTLDAPAGQLGATVSALQNGTQYFFSVAAVDSKGLESQQKSVILALSPVSSAGSPSVSPPLAALPVSSSFLVATPSQGAVMLQWQAFPGIFASKYKILFGLQPGQYTDYAFTQGSQTAALVNDLIDGVPYYFAVTALNSVGQEVSALSPEAMAVPSGSGFHASASSVPFGFGGAQASVLGNDQLAKVPAVAEAGFESLWLVLCSLLFAGLVYAYRRQARLSL